MYIVTCSKAYLQTPFAEPLPARSRPNLTAEATSHLNMDMLVGFYDHGTPSGLVFDSSLQNNVRQEIRKCFFDIFRGLCVSPKKCSWTAIHQTSSTKDIKGLASWRFHPHRRSAKSSYSLRSSWWWLMDSPIATIRITGVANPSIRTCLRSLRQLCSHKKMVQDNCRTPSNMDQSELQSPADQLKAGCDFWLLSRGRWLPEAAGNQRGPKIG